MTEAQLVEVLNLTVLVVYVGALVFGASTTFRRAWWFHSHGQRRPRLLTRDLIVFGGHALTFLSIVIARAFGWGPFVSGRWWWIVASAGGAVVGALTYCWYEVRVIRWPAWGRRGSR